ncbi:MAG: tRNA (cytidine(34)-2'-O)-methyltransferase [Magnetococcus sp. WYHC-3]
MQPVESVNDVSEGPLVPLAVVLYQPEIPHNTGALMRLCAATGVPLNLVGPLGFRLDAPALRRAGMDYRDLAVVRRHAHWGDFCTASAGRRLVAVTTRGDETLGRFAFAPGDQLLFGSEGAGLPPALHQSAAHRLRIPMRPGMRSLNLAMSVAVVLYEALRQLHYPGLADMNGGGCDT